MTYSILGLRAAPDEQIIAEHDVIAVSTSPGVNYYLEELDRRSRDRATEANDRLTRATLTLTKVSLGIGGGGLLLGIAALIVAIVHP